MASYHQGGPDSAAKAVHALVQVERVAGEALTVHADALAEVIESYREKELSR